MLRPVGRGLLVGAAAGLATQAIGRPGPALPLLLLAAGALGGLAVGAIGARRVRPIGAADAAWALDRLGGAGGRGLVAATVAGAVGAEAAWAEPRVEPPAVRMRPPEGLAVLAGSLLLATLSLLVAFAPARGDDGVGTLAPAAGGRAPGGAGGRPSAAPADEMERTARAADAVREALGLTETSAGDPAAVAERLRDLERRREAVEAARGTPLEGVIADPASSAEDVANAIARGRETAEEARRLRRRDASLRAAEGALPVPPGRRSLVERYLAQPGSGTEPR